MTLIKKVFLLLICAFAFTTFFSYKNKEKNKKLLKPNQVKLSFSYPSYKNDSTYLITTKELHKEFILKRASNLPTDSISVLVEKILNSYEKVSLKDINYTFQLYKDLWRFYEDIGDHSNAIKCMESFIVFCNTDKDSNSEFLLETYSVLINQLLYTGQCDKAIETVFIPAFEIIDNGLGKETLKSRIESLLLSKINMQTPYLLCARHMRDGDLQRRILRYSENLVKEKHDDIPNYNLYKADLLGMMTSTYIRIGDLSKARIFLDLYEKYMEPVDIIDDILLSFRKLYLHSQVKDKDKFYKELDSFNLLYAEAIKQFPPNTEEYLLAIGNKVNVLQSQEYLHESINPEDPKILEINHKVLRLINEFNYDTHINPLNAYDGLIKFYSRKKQKDSVFYYLKKFKTIATQINSNHHIRNAEISTIEYYLLNSDFSKVDMLLKKYLSQLKIENLEKALSDKNGLKNILADSQTIKRLIKLASLFLTYSHTNVDYLKPKSNLLYTLAANLLNVFKLNQGFNPNEIKLLKEINEGILATRVSSLKNDDVIIRILEGNQSLELLQKNVNKDIVIKQEDDLKLLINQRQKIIRKLSRIKKEYLDQRDNADITENETYLDLINSRDSINSKIKEKYPKYVFYTSPSFDLNKYQLSLDRETAVIRFYLTDSKSYAYVITKDSIEYYSLGNRQEINDLISDFTKAIREKEEISTLITAINAYLKPVLDNTGTYSNLKIIPHEELNFLPFAVILSDNFLNSNKTISYNSSLDLDVTRNKKVDGISIAVYAPKYANKENRNSEIVSTVERSGSYELPNAFEEATFITKLFNGRLFSGTDASKQNFIAHANDFPLLHLAMHATVADRESGREAMLLFSGNKKEDYMSIKDIYNLHISSNLITLSACSTAYGDIDPVEGVLSLSRAFHYAGSDATLTSLWRVPDKETAIIMKHFYENLKSGKSKSEALKKAKEFYLNNTEDPNLKHPYYWAGFILTGDTSPIILDNGISWGIYLIGGLIVLALLFFGIKKRLKTN